MIKCRNCLHFHYVNHTSLGDWYVREACYNWECFSRAVLLFVGLYLLELELHPYSYLKKN